MSDRTDAPGLLTPPEVAAEFRVSVKTIYRWSREGYLTPIRPRGRALRFRRADVDALLKDAS